MQHHHAKRTNLTKIVAYVTVKPGEMEKVCVGRYRERDPEPKFRLHYSPAQDGPNVVSHHMYKLGDHEVYDLYYQFQNYGDRSSTITIAIVEPDNRVT